MELSLVCVIQYDFVNVTLLRVELDVLQSLTDGNNCQLNKSLTIQRLRLVKIHIEKYFPTHNDTFPLKVDAGERNNLMSCKII